MSAQNNIIIMNRGDTFVHHFNARALGEYAAYELQGDDTIYFGIMDPGQYFEDALFKQKFDRDDLTSLKNLVLELEPEDTLDLLPGKYFYALKLQLDHEELDAQGYPTGNYVDKVITLINKTKFIIND
jgi:hypothetical protein